MAKKQGKLACFKCGRTDGIVRKGKRKNGSRWGLCHRCLADWYTEVALPDRELAAQALRRAEREP